MLPKRINNALNTSCIVSENACSKDVFQSDSKIIKTKIKDMKEREIDAIIKEEEIYDETGIFGDSLKKFTIYVNGAQAGYADVFKQENNILYLLDLHVQEQENRIYRNIGTELLKSVVKESEKQGCEGRVILNASHFSPPFAFYYKNNFKVAREKSAYYNAGIDYAARKNVPVSEVLPCYYTSLTMELDKNGAKAFLEGKKLYKERRFETIDSRKISGINFESNLIQSPDLNKNYLQIINTDNSNQCLCVEIEETKDKKGQKCLRFIKEFDVKTPEYILEYADEMAKVAAKKLGFEYCVGKNGKKL